MTSGLYHAGKEVGDRHPKVGDHVLIGTSATVLGNITIGDGAQIAAGSLVLKPVDPYTVVAGLPAKPVGKVPGDPDLKLQHWTSPLMEDGTFGPQLSSSSGALEGSNDRVLASSAALYQGDRAVEDVGLSEDAVLQLVVVGGRAMGCVVGSQDLTSSQDCGEVEGVLQEEEVQPGLTQVVLSVDEYGEGVEATDDDVDAAIRWPHPPDPEYNL